MGWQRHCADQLGILADGGARLLPWKPGVFLDVYAWSRGFPVFPFFPQWVFASVINSGNQLRLGELKPGVDDISPRVSVFMGAHAHGPHLIPGGVCGGQVHHGPRKSFPRERSYSE